MKNNKQKGDCVKQSSTPTEGLLLRASFLADFLSKHFDRIEKEGFKAEVDVPLIEEFMNQLRWEWMDYMEENGLEIKFPFSK